ncbi:SCO5918 family protein [Streptomyces sp. NPDC019396]|uniref:SCO5918 family protein n=1 Tax=Streptomyces sp. NPDC019396 TaxID=3154687 RepID=UPI0033C4FC89
MRCVIARFPFDLTRIGVLESMKGVKPEQVTGESVIIGRHTYPVKQVGQVITRQDRRDFSSSEVLRAMIKLGFTCPGPSPVPETTSALSPFQQTSVMHGTTPGPSEPTARHETSPRGVFPRP